MENHQKHMNTQVLQSWMHLLNTNEAYSTSIAKLRYIDRQSETRHGQGQLLPSWPGERPMESKSRGEQLCSSKHAYWSILVSSPDPPSTLEGLGTRLGVHCLVGACTWSICVGVCSSIAPKSQQIKSRSMCIVVAVICSASISR